MLVNYLSKLDVTRCCSDCNSNLFAYCSTNCGSVCALRKILDFDGRFAGECIEHRDSQPRARDPERFGYYAAHVICAKQVQSELKCST